MWIISHQIFNTWCQIILIKSRPQEKCCSLKFISKVFSKCFFVRFCCKNFMLEDTLFYHKILIFVWLLFFLVMVSHFSPYWTLICPFLLVSYCPNHRRKWETATHDGIVLFPWKQPRFCLWACCNLSGIDQGLIIATLAFIKFMLFKS